MDNERFVERRGDYLAAVTRLGEACREPFSEIVRDAVIQRFEFTHELAWKMLRLRLEEEGIVAGTPRLVMQEALQAGLIADGNFWSDVQKMRNLTSHTYSAALADQVYTFVRETGLGLFQQLAEECRTWPPSA